MHKKNLAFFQEHLKVFNQPEKFSFYKEMVPLAPIPHFAEILPALNMDFIGKDKRGVNLCDYWSCLSKCTLVSNNKIEELKVISNPVYFFNNYLERSKTKKRYREGLLHNYLEVKIEGGWHVFDRTIAQFDFARKFRHGIFSPLKTLPPELAVYYLQPERHELSEAELIETLQELNNDLASGWFMDYRLNKDQNF